MTDGQLEWILERIPEPKVRLKFAFYIASFALVCWPSTHLLILITQPRELASWTGHLLMAISWFAILYTAMDHLETADVRHEQEGE